MNDIKRLFKKTNNKTVRTFFTLILFILFLIFNQSENNLKLNLFTPTPTITPTISYEINKVKRVIDGDTVELENGQIVRYIGIDAPELHHPKKTIECFASASAIFNKNLVEGKIVRLEKDISETDRYKRLLRYVYVVNQSSSSAEIFVNRQLIQEGYAYASTFPPDVKYEELFRQAQEEGMVNNRGLWKSCKN